MRPLTLAVSKHLLPVGAEPMIYHPIRKLAEAGIREVMVVTGTEHAGQVLQTLGSGKAFATDSGARLALTYRVQDTAGGIAEALSLARDFVGELPFVVLLGDNVFGAHLGSLCARFEDYAWCARQDGDAAVGMVCLKEVPDPQRFGVAEVQDGRIVSLEEKPEKPRSALAVTGIYFYQGRELFEQIKRLTPSARGELEITDLNRELLRRGRLYCAEPQGYWSDAGTPESYRKANEWAWSTST